MQRSRIWDKKHDERRGKSLDIRAGTDEYQEELKQSFKMLFQCLENG